MFHIDGIEQDDLEKLEPVFRDVLHYWQIKAEKAGGIPTLIDIDLMELWQHASYLTVKDIERDAMSAALRFRWRYAGTMLYELTGLELTGRYLDEIFEPGDAVHDIEAGVVMSGRPHFWKRYLENKASNRAPVMHECMTLPLTNEKGSIAHTISVNNWDEEDEEGAKPLLLSNNREGASVKVGSLTTQYN